MKKIQPLNYKNFRQNIDPSTFNFTNTNEIKSLTELIGQKRAQEALMFGIGIKSDGFNLFAMGARGVGKRIHIKRILTENAVKMPAPFDWCYVYNFIQANKPVALKLKAGKGIALKQDMEKFINEIAASILAIFESEKYRQKLDKIRHLYDTKRTKKLDSAPRLYKFQYLQEKKLQRIAIASILRQGIKKLSKKYGKNSR